MIERMSVFILCLVLSGCSSALSLPFAGEPDSSVSDAPAVRQHCDISSVEASVDKMTLLPEEFVVADPALLDGDSESLLLDLETLADTLLLTGFEQHPLKTKVKVSPQTFRCLIFRSWKMRRSTISLLTIRAPDGEPSLAGWPVPGVTCR